MPYFPRRNARTASRESSFAEKGRNSHLQGACVSKEKNLPPVSMGASRMSSSPVGALAATLHADLALTLTLRVPRLLAVCHRLVTGW